MIWKAGVAPFGSMCRVWTGLFEPSRGGEVFFVAPGEVCHAMAEKGNLEKETIAEYSSVRVLTGNS